LEGWIDPERFNSYKRQGWDKNGNAIITKQWFSYQDLKAARAAAVEAEKAAKRLKWAEDVSAALSHRMPKSSSTAKTPTADARKERDLGTGRFRLEFPKMGRHT